MTISKTYLYFGETGTFTSSVLIPGAPSLTYVNMRADEGKMLTDGTRKLLSVTVLETAADKWQEVEADEED
jgi:hypothetical protein